MKKHISRLEVERAARIYKTNRAAAAALGIQPGWFGELCQKYNIETPFVRCRRQEQEARQH